MRRQGPHFLCIGMPKAGTDWLYEAFRANKNYLMLPIKELHHFDQRHADGRFEKLQERLERRSKDTALMVKKWDVFQRRLDAYRDSNYSHESYRALFSIGRKKLSGDITPAYCTLPPEEVAEIRQVLPQVKVLFLVRHPVERAWSHYLMILRRELREYKFSVLGKLKKKTLEDMRKTYTLHQFFSSNNMLQRSFPSHVMENWSQFEDDLMIIDFQDIVQNPFDVCKKVFEFTGAPHAECLTPEVFTLPENRKSKSKSLPMTEEDRKFLREFFADEIKACKTHFPEIAKGWE